MRSNLISEGVVDERSITDLRPADLHGFKRVHLFAGIGGWEYALRLAGWSDEPVWTGSCPCQPFSAAGKRQGEHDSRHLWPQMFRLISECRPATVFGEQVSGAIGFGWLDRVFADLEGEGYACGAAVLGAHSVGAPHVRQRLFWVAYSSSERLEGAARASIQGGSKRFAERRTDGALDDPDARHLANAQATRPGQAWQAKQAAHHRRKCKPGRASVGMAIRLGDTSGAGLEERRCQRSDDEQERKTSERTGNANGRLSFWGNAILTPCLDGKARRIEPTIFPLAHGLPGRVGLLRGAGNAIVPQAAAAFIKAFMKSVGMED